MGNKQAKIAKNSIEAQKINEFFSYYGHKSGPQIEKWLDTMYSPNFYGSTTLNYGQSKTTQINRQSLPSVYERAYKGQYRPHDIVFEKVQQKSRTIFYKWINNTPHVSDPSKRVQIPFQSYVVFDQNYRILKAVHRHCPQQKKVVEYKQIQSQRPGYWQKVLDRAEDNMKVVNQLLSQNYVPDTSVSDKNYQQSQKRFHDNKRKQAQEYNNWVRSQNNRYY